MIERERRNVDQRDERKVIEALVELMKPAEERTMCARKPLAEVSLMNLSRLATAAETLANFLVVEQSDRIAAMRAVAADASAA